MPNVIAIWHVRINIVTSDIKQILGKRSLTRLMDTPRIKHDELTGYLCFLIYRR